jgi:peptide/nickel transport system permease protein
MSAIAVRQLNVSIFIATTFTQKQPPLDNQHIQIVGACGWALATSELPGIGWHITGIGVDMMEFWMRFRRDRLALAGLIVIAVFFAAAFAAPLLAPYNPSEQFFDGLTLEGSPLPPGRQYWFGTDTNGRDQFSRLLFGGQTSLLIGIVANGIAVLVGTTLGLIAGYLRGFTGAAIMRLTDLMMAFPPLLLAIALSAILKPGLGIVILVIALVNWVQIARVIYAETTALSEREYIEAARALGAGTARILWRHLLPHLVPTIVVYSTLGIATTVLLESMLSFLGRGVQPPTPAWGMMIFESQSYFLNAPWLVFIPGAAILILALAFNLVGDGLRDALDPTQRGRG